MYTSSQRPSSDPLTKNYAFRSITTFIKIIETRSASRTASESRFFFCNRVNNLTSTERLQLRLNTALSVCAVRNLEVIAVASSSDKTAGISSSYIVTVNPKFSDDILLASDVLYYQTTDSETPHLVSGKGGYLTDPTNFIRSRLWVQWTSTEYYLIDPLYLDHPPPPTKVSKIISRLSSKSSVAKRKASKISKFFWQNTSSCRHIVKCTSGLHIAIPNLTWRAC